MFSKLLTLRTWWNSSFVIPQWYQDTEIACVSHLLPACSQWQSQLLVCESELELLRIFFIIPNTMLYPIREETELEEERKKEKKKRYRPGCHTLSSWQLPSLHNGLQTDNSDMTVFQEHTTEDKSCIYRWRPVSERRCTFLVLCCRLGWLYRLSSYSFKDASCVDGFQWFACDPHTLADRMGTRQLTQRFSPDWSKLIQYDAGSISEYVRQKIKYKKIGDAYEGETVLGVVLFPSPRFEEMQTMTVCYTPDWIVGHCCILQQISERGLPFLLPPSSAVVFRCLEDGNCLPQWVFPQFFLLFPFPHFPPLIVCVC